jgi:hypothetical protein
MVVGQAGATTIVMHFSQGNGHRLFRCDQSNDSILRWISESNADVVVLKPWRQLTKERCEWLVKSMANNGMKLICLDRLPIAESAYFVMVRTDGAKAEFDSAIRR